MLPICLQNLAINLLVPFTPDTSLYLPRLLPLIALFICLIKSLRPLHSVWLFQLLSWSARSDYLSYSSSPCAPSAYSFSSLHPPCLIKSSTSPLFDLHTPAPLHSIYFARLISLNLIALPPYLSSLFCPFRLRAPLIKHVTYEAAFMNCKPTTPILIKQMHQHLLHKSFPIYHAQAICCASTHPKPANQPT